MSPWQWIGWSPEWRHHDTSRTKGKNPDIKAGVKEHGKELASFHNRLWPPTNKHHQHPATRTIWKCSSPADKTRWHAVNKNTHAVFQGAHLRTTLWPLSLLNLFHLKLLILISIKPFLFHTHFCYGSAMPEHADFELLECTLRCGVKKGRSVPGQSTVRIQSQVFVCP